MRKAGKTMHENLFEYCGFRFIPYRRLTENEKSFNYAMRNLASDMELGIMNYDRPEAKHPYDHAEIYKLSKEKDCDLFLCLDNGKLYIPCENELMRWTGDIRCIDSDYSKRSNIGYEIFKTKRYDTGEIVIGCNPKAAEPFVCWYCKNGTDYFWGRYGETYDSVLERFNEGCRTEDRMKRSKPVKGEPSHER